MITEVPNDQPVPTPDDNEPTFDALAAAMPETAQGFLDAVLPPSAHEGVGGAAPTTDEGFIPSEVDPSSGPRKRVNVSKKMRKAMNKFKGKVANVPIMWFHTQAKNNPEWELDADEKELITDSIDTVFEVLDIEVEIEPLSWTLTSIWWVVGYPVLAFVFLFLTKKSLTMDREKTGEVEV